MVSNRHFASVLCLVLSTYPAVAQRHGRADSVQNYLRLSLSPNPQIAIKLEPSHSWVYFHKSDLKMMKHIVVTVLDPQSGKPMTYAGVRFDDLLPRPLVENAFELLTHPAFRFREMHVASSAGMDPKAERIIADSLNGEVLTGDNPFRFVSETTQGGALVVKDIDYISILAMPR